MRNGNVKNYILNEDGKYQIYDETQIELEKKYNIDPEYLADEVNKALHDNPFLLTNNPNIKSQIDTIENFYIVLNNEKITFESFIRDDSYNKKTKKKVIIKQLKQWKQDAIEKLDNIIAESKETFLRTHQERYKIINTYQLFYLIVSFIISLLLVFNAFKFTNNNIINKIIGITTICLSIICFVLVFIQHKKIYIFNNELTVHFDQYKNYSKKNKKKIKRNYKRLKKYYSNGYLNNHFQKAAYPIKNVFIDMKKFEEIEENDKDIIGLYDNILKENKGINIYYHIPLVLSYGLLAINGIYIIIMILIRIFKLIFMKGE